MAQSNNAMIDIPIRDIHVPESVSWWPPAIGWWLVVGAILLMLLILVVAVVWHNKRRYKRLAQAEFHKLVTSYKQVADPIVYLRDLSIYLRQTAMLFYSREHVAGLTGEKWLQFLDQTKSANQSKNTGSESSVKFQSELGTLLLTTPYDPLSPINPDNVDQLTLLVQSWVAALPLDRGGYSRQAG